ncbi:MAG: hypothetical protein V4604_11720 [Bacteroidota bacterium]
MSLKKVETELEECGYICTFHKITDALHCGIHDDRTVLKLDLMFQVSEKANDYVCSWFYYNDPMEESFSSIEELLKFVKEKFPIN